MQQTEVLDQGLNRITGNHIELAGEPEVLYTDPLTGVKSMYYRVAVSRSITYDNLLKMKKNGYDYQLLPITRRFYKSIRSRFVVYVFSDDLHPSRWSANTPLHLIRPSTGQAANIWTFEDIQAKYMEVEEAKEAKTLWDDAEQRSREECVHGPSCKRKKCEVGKAVQTIHIVSGQFVVLWGFLQECVPQGKRLRLVQVEVEPRDEDEDEEATIDSNQEEEVKKPLLITGVRILGSMSEELKQKLKEMEKAQCVEGDLDGRV